MTSDPVSVAEELGILTGDLGGDVGGEVLSPFCCLGEEDVKG